MKALLLALVLSFQAHADLDLSALGNITFGTVSATHYVQTQSNDNLILQTGAADENGFGGGLNLISGNSVQIQSGGDGGISIATQNTSSITLDSAGGSTVVVGDSMAVFTLNGLQLYQWAASTPTCNEGRRGTLYFSPNGEGVADTLQVCMKAADESFSWKTVSF